MNHLMIKTKIQIQPYCTDPVQVCEVWSSWYQVTLFNLSP